jgi:hypothetical protein
LCLGRKRDDKPFSISPRVSPTATLQNGFVYSRTYDLPLTQYHFHADKMGFTISITFSSGFNPATGQVYGSAPVVPEEYRCFLYTGGRSWIQVVDRFENSKYCAESFYANLPAYEDLTEKDELEEEEYEEFKNAMKWFAEYVGLGGCFVVDWSW